jgi:hypothetical protein
MNRIAAAVLLLAAVAPAARAQQEACKMEMNVPAMTLADMYAKSEKIAKAWKADAVPARITNTSMGPLDEKGRSEAWNLTFYSPAGNASVTINTFRGMFTCYAQPGDAGRIPDLKPGFFRDGARLYAIAKEKGGNLIADGYTVSVGTAAAPETRHATWYLHFEKADGKTAPRTIIVDANSGAVEQVLD